MSKVKVYKSFFVEYSPTVGELEWMATYENATGFEPVSMDLVRDRASFITIADQNCKWYERHSSDAHLSITNALNKLKP